MKGERDKKMGTQKKGLPQYIIFRLVFTSPKNHFPADVNHSHFWPKSYFKSHSPSFSFTSSTLSLMLPCSRKQWQFNHGPAFQNMGMCTPCFWEHYPTLRLGWLNITRPTAVSSISEWQSTWVGLVESPFMNHCPAGHTLIPFSFKCMPRQIQKLTTMPSSLWKQQ